ncbi:MAG: hypothetical protein MHMPM18_001912 [Marteilia pararefringens]
MGRGRSANKHSNLSQSEDTVGLLTVSNGVTSGHSPWQFIKARLASKCTRKSKRLGILVCVAILVCIAILLGIKFANNGNIIRKTSKDDGSGINSKLCGFRKVEHSRVKRVGEGVESRENSWPWQVSIQIGEVHYGSGSLINDQWVLTAAHVVEEMKDEVDYLSAKIGEHRLDKKDRSEREYEIASLYIHPQYDRKTLRYDIALVKLDEKVKFGANISPVCLPEAETDLPQPGTKCFVTGWGITGTQSQSNKLREVDLKLISQDVCKQSGYYKTDIKDDMICAGNVEDGKGTCQGDSGAPLIYLDPKNAKWTQIGISSWGHGCANPEYPSVFHRVNITKEWVVKIINNN